MKQYLSLVKFSHTIFAMPFALTGFFIATTTSGSDFRWQTLLLVLVCMVTARNAAMGFNRYLDRDIDAKNPRTQTREIPAGIIQPKAAFWFVILNCAVFIAATWFINLPCFLLSPVALAVSTGGLAVRSGVSRCCCQQRSREAARLRSTAVADSRAGM